MITDWMIPEETNSPPAEGIETVITDWMIPEETNSPPAEVSKQ